MKYLLRIVLALVFIASALAKVFSIDTFELYLFGFELCSLEWSFLLARLVIAAELGLGLWFIINTHNRLPYYGAWALLGGFSLFLLALALMGHKESCHCFGQWIEMNPWQSLLKNVGLMVLLWLSRNCPQRESQRGALWPLLALVGALAFVFILSPPDNWRYQSYHRHTQLNQEELTRAAAQGTLPMQWIEGNNILCFYSLDCEFCRMSASKLASLRRRGEMPAYPVHVLFGGTPRDPQPFFDQTTLEYSQWTFIPAADFVKITYGTLPLILVIENGQVVQQFSYRDLH